MKLTKKASGKIILSMSREEWQAMGHQNGWFPSEDAGGDIGQEGHTTPVDSGLSASTGGMSFNNDGGAMGEEGGGESAGDDVGTGDILHNTNYWSLGGRSASHNHFGKRIKH
jgi:hypothetical protein